VSNVVRLLRWVVACRVGRARLGVGLYRPGEVPCISSLMISSYLLTKLVNSIDNRDPVEVGERAERNGVEGGVVGSAYRITPITVSTVRSIHVFNRKIALHEQIHMQHLYRTAFV